MKENLCSFVAAWQLAWQPKFVAALTLEEMERRLPLCYISRFACDGQSRLPFTNKKSIVGPKASTMHLYNRYLPWCEAFLSRIKKL